MMKKIVLGIVFVGFVGLLVVGGVIRAGDRVEREATLEQGYGWAEHSDATSGRGRGAGSAGVGVADTRDTERQSNQVEQSERDGQGQGYGRGQSVGQAQGNGQGAGQAQGAGTSERLYPNVEQAPDEWIWLEGVVTQAPDDGVDLMVETDAGDSAQIGTGPNYLASQGFALQVGEEIKAYGYWDDDEFKAGELVRARDGATITLRDELGRPAWAGAGQRAGGGSGH